MGLGEGNECIFMQDVYELWGPEDRLSPKIAAPITAPSIVPIALYIRSWSVILLSLNLGWTEQLGLPTEHNGNDSLKLQGWFLRNPAAPSWVFWNACPSHALSESRHHVWAAQAHRERQHVVLQSTSPADLPTYSQH